MKHTLFKALAASGAAALLLTACESGGAADDSSEDSASEDPVYAEMASWDACEVLDHLQPITDYMGIKGYGSGSSEGGEPGNQELGNTLDPEAIGCGSLIYLGSYEDMNMSGELNVKIIPSESGDQATTAYENRVASAKSEASEWSNVQSQEFDEPWDQGTIVSWVGNARNPNVEVIARDGQWVFHIQLYHAEDFGLDATGDPVLPFAVEDRNQWLVETYLPEMNQTVNGRLTEVE